MKTILYASLLLATIFVSSCNNSDNPTPAVVPPPEIPFTLYSAGSIESSSIFNYFVWKDDKQVPLLNPNVLYDDVLGISVSGEDVYILALELGTGSSPDAYTIYKNGVRSLLLEDDGANYPNGIIVNGKDVYAYGRVSDNSISKAAYWKNGVKTILSNNTSFVYGATIDNGDIYFSGTISDDADVVRSACYWKNGSVNKLSSEYSQAFSIKIIDKKVYVCGEKSFVIAEGNSTRYGTFGAYWIDGVETTLESSNDSYSKVRGVIKKDNDLYFCGIAAKKDGNTVTLNLWKNGKDNITALTESGNRAIFGGIFLSGSDVIISGSESGGGINGEFQAKIWKNGVATSITDDTLDARISVATSNK